MRVSSPDKLLRTLVLDPRANPKHRTEALLSMDRPSLRFLEALLRGTGKGKKKLPATLVLAATAVWRTRKGELRKKGTK